MLHLGLERSLPSEIFHIAKSTRRWALSKNGGVPDGMCYFATARIVKMIRELGQEAIFMEGKFDIAYEDHYWVQYNGGILDVTADQFNFCLPNVQMRAIVYGNNQELSNLYRHGERVGISIQELKKIVKP